MREDVRYYRSHEVPVSAELWCMWSAFAISVVLFIYFFAAQFSGFVQNEVFLLDKINPNTASSESLFRLSGIGRVRAEAIVNYRESNSREASGGAVFENCSDLERVKGIGPKTVEKVRGYLVFESGAFFIKEPENSRNQ